MLVEQTGSGECFDFFQSVSPIQHNFPIVRSGGNVGKSILGNGSGELDGMGELLRGFTG